MSKITSLEDLVKQYLKKNPNLGAPDSYDLYKHKNGVSDAKTYSDAVRSLHASSRKISSSYGENSRNINNKGLQNSGYSTYVDDLSDINLSKNLNDLRKEYLRKEGKNHASYVSYLEKYSDKKQKVKNDVTSHLIKNDVVDLNTAIAYGMAAGLSKDDAEAAGQSAYEITKKKVFNNIIEKAMTLGLDKNGTKALALKMGISESDADEISDQVAELIEYYTDVSDDYLDFLEERSK